MAKKGTTGNGSSNAKTSKLKSPNSKGKSKRGGAREGAGRKSDPEKDAIKKLKDMATNHSLEEAEVVLTTARGQQIAKLVRKIAILDMLFSEAIRNKNVAAAREYMDRSEGKATQPIDLDGELKVSEQYTPEYNEAVEVALEAYRKAKEHGKAKRTN